MEFALILIGGAIGFLSSIGKDFFLERSKNKIKQNEFKRQKLEKVFVLMDKVFQESIKPIEYRGSLDGVGAEASTIIRFYFPDLQEDYSVFIKSLQTINAKFTPDNKHPIDNESIIKFSKEYSKFINKIVEESKKYI